jgi:hypothetical protein
MTSPAPETGGRPNMLPAIEKKYGKPISEWMDIIGASPLTKHSEVVNWLKTDHGVGHGHATALVHEHKRQLEAQ